MDEEAKERDQDKTLASHGERLTRIETLQGTMNKSVLAIEKAVVDPKGGLAQRIAKTETTVAIHTKLAVGSGLSGGISAAIYGVLRFFHIVGPKASEVAAEVSKNG